MRQAKRSGFATGMAGYYGGGAGGVKKKKISGILFLINDILHDILHNRKGVRPMCKEVMELVAFRKYHAIPKCRIAIVLGVAYNTYWRWEMANIEPNRFCKAVIRKFLAKQKYNGHFRFGKKEKQA
jgi:hypothetical protein